MKSKLLPALVAVFVAYSGWVSGDANAEVIKSGILTSGDDSRGLITSVPRIMTYQGILTSTEGVIPDDIYDITFRIYTGPDDIDPIWSETYPCTTSNGYFTAVLAMETPWNLPFDTDYYLSLQVEDDPEMSPRQRLTMSPYAARSDTCDFAFDAQHSVMSDFGGRQKPVLLQCEPIVFFSGPWSIFPTGTNNEILNEFHS